MVDFTGHPAFPTFVICAALLVLKMIAVGHWTGYVRIQRRAILNPEDVATFKSEASASGDEDPEVARALRAHRNDLESTLPFLAIGLPYLLTDPSTALASGLFVAFTAFRLVFSVFYLRGMQPWRSLTFVLGELCTVAIVVQMLVWGFRH